MKRIIFLLFLSTPICAQTPKFLIGLNASAIWNSYSLTQSKPPYILNGRMNFGVGIQSKYFVGKKFWLDGKINFATKNFDSGIDYSYLKPVDYEASLWGQSHYTVKQNYIEIPVSINYFLNSSEKLNFFCSLGLNNSIMLSATKSGNDPHSDPNQLQEKYESYLLSTRIGGGLFLPMGKDFYSTIETFTDIYLVRTNKYLNSPFQLALGFSVLKKIGKNSSPK